MIRDLYTRNLTEDVVYVGEYHDRFSHQNVQLQLIKALHRAVRSLAVGMEMFQRPFQGMLDAYVSGGTDEKEFLRTSQYFKRWGFDYNLYKPILDYCRVEKLPVVALNQRREITDKVSKGGIDSLTADERKELPREMDFSDDAYRRRIRQSFDQNKGKEEKDFDHFLQAQVLWDETMAESIDDYLKKEPGRRMVVIAGGGHVVYGFQVRRPRQVATPPADHSLYTQPPGCLGLVQALQAP